VTHAATTRARARTLIWIRRITALGAALIAAAAFTLSFENLSAAALAVFPAPLHYLFSVAIDCIILVASADIVRCTLEGRSTLAGWALKVLAVAVSVAFNITGHLDSPADMFMVAALPVCQAVAVWVLMRNLHSTSTPVAFPARARAKAQDTTDVSAAPVAAPVTAVATARPNTAVTPLTPRATTPTSGGKRAEIEQVVDRWQAEGQDPWARGAAPRIADEVGGTPRYVREVLADLQAARDAGDTASGTLAVAAVRAVA
jgi:hypothetical protein